MEHLLLILSLVLAGVLVVAGVAKLLDRNGSRSAAHAFGVPDRLAGLVAVGLPLAELATAFLLFFPGTRWWGALAALVLLVLFTAVVARALARGEAPDCHCFGQLHSSPAGRATLARNVVLAGAAAFVAVAARGDAGSSAVAWTRRLEGAEWLVLALAVLLGVVAALGGFVVAHVLRSYGRVLVRLDAVEQRLRDAGLELEESAPPELGLEPGSAAPSFWLPSTEGDRVALGDLLEPGVPVLLLFTSPTCGPCSLLMPTVARWQREHAETLTVALLTDGEPERIRADAVEHGLRHVLVDETLSAYEAYGANGTPSAVLVAPDGTIASWLAAGAEWIEMLVEQALDGGGGGVAGLPVGSELPALDVELLDGTSTRLADLAVARTVVLFWNPGCGFCRALHEDVLAWESGRAEDAPRLIVVSAGAADDVHAEGFTSPVLLDPDWAIAGAFGAHGTPMALLVDADGRVATTLATGADAVLRLLASGTATLAAWSGSVS